MTPRDAIFIPVHNRLLANQAAQLIGLDPNDSGVLVARLNRISDPGDADPTFYGCCGIAGGLLPAIQAQAANFPGAMWYRWDSAKGPSGGELIASWNGSENIGTPWSWGMSLADAGLRINSPAP